MAVSCGPIRGRQRPWPGILRSVVARAWARWLSDDAHLREHGAEGKMTDQSSNEQVVSDPKVLHPAEIELFDRGTGVKTIPLIGKWNTQGNKVTTGITIFGPGTQIPLHTHNVEE